MLVKIPDAPDDLVERVKAATGMATASKAFLAAARELQPLRDRVEDLNAQIASLQARLAESQNVIASAKSAAATLLGRVDPGKKSPASLKDLGDWFDSQAALDLGDEDEERKKLSAACEFPSMPYV